MSISQRLLALVQKEEGFQNDDERQEVVDDLMKAKDHQERVKVINDYGLNNMLDEVAFVFKAEELQREEKRVELVDPKEIELLRKEVQKGLVLSTRKKLEALRQLPDTDFYKTMYWCLLGCRVFQLENSEPYESLMNEFKITKEELTSKFYQFQEQIKKASSPLNSADPIKDMIERLDLIKTKNIPFDILELIQLIEQGEEASKDVQNLIDEQKKFIVLIGRTGAGKTTFILGCCDHKMVEKQYINGLSWITTQNQVTDPKLKQLISYPGSKSVTRNVLAIPLPNDSNFVILDTPGFSDTNGPEQDAANCRVMVNSLTKFTKVSIAVMVNGKNQGGRCEGVKQLCTWLSKLFQTYDKVEKSINFIFNRYTDKDLRQIHKECQEVISQTEKLPNRNENYLRVLEHLKEHTEQLSNMFSYNPLDQNASKQIAKFFKDVKKNNQQLGNPGGSFDLTFSAQTRSAIKDQSHCLQKVILEYFDKGEFKHSRFYFNLFKSMVDLTAECKQQLNGLKETIQSKINKTCESSIYELSMRIGDSSLSVNDVNKFKEVLKTLDAIKNQFSELFTNLFQDQKRTMLSNVEEAVKAIVNKIQKSTQIQPTEMKSKVQNFKRLISVVQKPQEQIEKLATILRSKTSAFQQQWKEFRKINGVSKSIKAYNSYFQFKTILKYLIDEQEHTTFFIDELRAFAKESDTTLRVSIEKVNQCIRQIKEIDSVFAQIKKYDEFMVMLTAEEKAEINDSLSAGMKRFQDMVLDIPKRIKQRIRKFELLNCRQSDIDLLKTDMDRIKNLAEINYLKDELEAENIKIKQQLSSYVSNQERKLSEVTETLKKETFTSSYVRDILKRLRISIMVMDNVSLFYGDYIEDKNSLTQQAQKCLKDHFEKIINKLRVFDINFNKSEQLLEEDIQWLDDVIDIGNIYEQKSEIQIPTIFKKSEIELTEEESGLESSSLRNSMDSSKSDDQSQRKYYMQMKHPCKQIKERSDDIIAKCIKNFKECFQQFADSYKEDYFNISMKKVNKCVLVIQSMKNRLKIPRNKQFEEIHNDFLKEINNLKTTLITKTDQEIDSLLLQAKTQDNKLYHSIKSKISIVHDIAKEYPQIEKEIGCVDDYIKLFKTKIEQLYQQISGSEAKLEDKNVKSSQLKELKIVCDMAMLFNQFLKNVGSDVSFQTLSAVLRDTKNIHDKQFRESIKAILCSKNYFKLNKIFEKIQGTNLEYAEEELVVRIENLLETVQHRKNQAKVSGILEGELLHSLEQLAKIRTNILQQKFLTSNKDLLARIDQFFIDLKDAIITNLQTKKKEIMENLQLYKLNRARKCFSEYIEKEGTLSETLSKITKDINTSSSMNVSNAESVKSQIDNLINKMRKDYSAKPFNFDQDFYRIWKNFLTQDTDDAELQKLKEAINMRFEEEVQEYMSMYYDQVYHNQEIFTKVRTWANQLPEPRKTQFLKELQELKKIKTQKIIDDQEASEKNIAEIKKNNALELIKHRKQVLSTTFASFPEDNKQTMHINTIKAAFNEKIESADFTSDGKLMCEYFKEFEREIDQSNTYFIKMLKDLSKKIQQAFESKEKDIMAMFKEILGGNGKADSEKVIQEKMAWLGQCYNSLKASETSDKPKAPQWQSPPKLSSQKSKQSETKKMFNIISETLNKIIREIGSKYGNSILEIKPQIIFKEFDNKRQIKDSMRTIKRLSILIFHIECTQPFSQFYQRKFSSYNLDTRLPAITQKFSSVFKKLKDTNLSNSIQSIMNDDETSILLYAQILKQHIEGIESYYTCYLQNLCTKEQEPDKKLTEYKNEFETVIKKYQEQIKKNQHKIVSLTERELIYLKQCLKIVKCFNKVFSNNDKNVIAEFDSCMTKNIDEYAKKIKTDVEILSKTDKEHKKKELQESLQFKKQLDDFKNKCDATCKQEQRKIDQKFNNSRNTMTKQQNQSQEEFDNRSKELESQRNVDVNILSNELEEKLMKKAREIAEKKGVEEKQRMNEINQIVERIVKNLIDIKTIEMNLESVESSKNQGYKEAMKSIERLRSKNIKFIVVGLESVKDSKVGKFILANEECFRSVFIEKILKKTNAMTIDKVLGNLELHEIRKKNLQSMYRQYLLVYEQNLKDYERNPYPTSINQLVNRTKQLAASYKDKALDGEKLVAHIQSLYSILTSKKDQDNNVEIQFKPHSAQVIAIFLELDLGQDMRDMSNKFCQVNTGEGKSLILASVACFFALIGYDIRCVCYSKFLSKRDYNNFIILFQQLGIQKQIRYLDFFQLMEEMCNNSQFKIREVINNILIDNKTYQNIKIPLEQKKNTILLIDEVDTFFNTDFYGQSYAVYTSIKNKLIQELLSYIWYNKNDITMGSLLESEEYKSLVERMKPIEAFIKEAAKSMLNVIARPNKDLKYVIQNDKIAYKEQDSIMSNVSYGYQTVFSYFEEYQKKNIKTLPETMSEIGISICEISYAEIIKQFKYIIGVSGTLQNLEKAHIQILKNQYSINSIYSIPSVYGANHLEVNGVQIFDGQQYYHEIAKQTIQAISHKRPVLIFCENIQEANDIFLHKDFEMLKAKTVILSQKHDQDARKQKIQRATVQGSITILTRVFGRGTDFVLYDQSLSNKGGILVIQTFLSDDQGQDTQIKGRTARQGDRGSHSLILKKSELQKIGLKADSISECTNEQKWKRIVEARKNFNSKKWDGIEQSVKQLKVKHENLKELFILIGSKNNQKVRSKLIQLNIVAQPLQRKGPVRTLIGIDATQSMECSLKELSKILPYAFERLYDIVNAGNPNYQAVKKPGFEIQVAYYRNYDSEQEEYLFGHSKFETSHEKLIDLLVDATPYGGWGNQAIELLYQHANSIEKLSQVVIIADAGANTKWQTDRKREKNPQIWRKSKRFNTPCYAEQQLKKLIEKNIQIHSLYIGTSSEYFQQVSKLTNGESREFFPTGDNAEQMLTNFISTKILEKMGESEEETIKFVELYKKKWGG